MRILKSIVIMSIWKNSTLNKNRENRQHYEKIINQFYLQNYISKRFKKYKFVFKYKFLELLKKYKMELTKLHIKVDYLYNNFFVKIKCKNFEASVEKNVIL